MTSLAVLGLGRMGRRVAHNAVAAGHDLTVWNRTPAVADEFAAQHPGVRVAGTLSAETLAVDTVLVMVTDDDASRQVWLDRGVLDALGPGVLAVEMSTLSPTWTSDLAERARTRGMPFVAAPVLGSTPQADAAALVALVGGHPDLLPAVEEALAPSTGRLLHVGSPRDAAVRKLVVNGWLAGQTALAAELLWQLETHGVDRGTAAGFLADLPLTSSPLAAILGRMADGEDTPRFPVHLVAKDVGYLAETARRPLLDAVASAWSNAAERVPQLDLGAYLTTIASSEE